MNQLKKQIKCKCSCGEFINSFDKKGRKRFYKMGHQRIGSKMSQKQRQVMIESHRGKSLSKEHKNKLSVAHKGKIFSIEHREKIRQNMLGKKNHQWKGGITQKIISLRNSVEYREWREKVFKRDNYTCLECGSNTGKKDKWGNFLNADHIKPISRFPELAFDLDNGRTFCVWCHRQTPTYGINAKYLLR